MYQKILQITKYSITQFILIHTTQEQYLTNASGNVVSHSVLVKGNLYRFCKALQRR